MARLDHVHPAMRAALLAMACPTFDTQPWVAGPALRQRRVALISTAGPHRRDDRPIAVTSGNARAVPGELSDTDLLRAALQREIDQVRTWYDLAVTRCGHTTVGVSRLTPEEMGTFIGAFLDGQAPPNPRSDIPLAALFRYAVEDLKAYYGEALAAQPGHSTVDSTTLADWFWRDTTAGRVLFAVHEVCKQSAVPGMQAVAAGLLIPRARSAESPFAKA